jgi:Na+-driven multidrug efflux pump
VTALYSAELNASFYIAWMIAGFAFVGPLALTNVLYSMGAAQPDTLDEKLRLSLAGSLLVGGAISGMLIVGAPQVLELFGPHYVAEAHGCLRILAVGVFPMIIKQHYIAIGRIHKRIAAILPLVLAGNLLELLLASTGAAVGGLAGLGLGWVVALVVQAVIMGGTVGRVARARPAPPLE